MKIQAHGKDWQIRRKPSVFVSRSGKDDVRIWVESDHGARFSDGKRYSSVQVLAAESGEFIRNYGAIPEQITPNFLRQNGFLDQPAS